MKKKNKDSVNKIYTKNNEMEDFNLDVSEHYSDEVIEEIENMKIEESEMEEEENLDNKLNKFIDNYKGTLECDRPLYFFRLKNSNDVLSGIPLARLNKEYFIWKINGKSQKIKTSDIILEKEKKEIENDFTYSSYLDYLNDICEIALEDFEEFELSELIDIINEQWHEEIKEGFDNQKDPLEVYKYLKHFIVEFLEDI